MSANKIKISAHVGFVLRDQLLAAFEGNTNPQGQDEAKTGCQLGASSTPEGVIYFVRFMKVNPLIVFYAVQVSSFRF